MHRLNMSHGGDHFETYSMAPIFRPDPSIVLDPHLCSSSVTSFCHVSPPVKSKVKRTLNDNSQQNQDQFPNHHFQMNHFFHCVDFEQQQLSRYSFLMDMIGVDTGLLNFPMQLPSGR